MYQQHYNHNKMRMPSLKNINLSFGKNKSGKPYGMVLTLLFLFSSLFLFSQEATGVSAYPDYKVYGTLKNKFEYATGPGTSRFSVRNSRIGVAGNINTYSSYKVQVELSNEGKFSVLDLSGTLKPIDGLSLTLGQTSIPLFNSYIVDPFLMMFANRAFLGKYMIGSRDLGFLTKYDLKLGTVPTRLEFGVFNGNTINDPVWKDNLSYGGRIELGNMKGFRMTAKIYDYPNDEETHYLFYGADLRYARDNWTVETEIMKRESKTEFHTDLLSCYLQSAYIIPIRTKMFDFFKPAVRWDAIDERKKIHGFDVNRLTAGIGFGFKREGYSSLLRIDYEWYKVNHKMTIFESNEEMDSNKITIELLFSF